MSGKERISMDGQYQTGDTVMKNWVLTKKLGEGSFGKVFRIERTDFGETYHAALKIITVPQSESEVQAALEEGMSPEEAERYFYGMVEDIVREFALMAKLKGTAHVVSYEDHEVLRHREGIGWDILIRMEELTPLLAYAYANPFTRRDIIRLGIHICHSLELCQKYNIIHRDIKPENIFVSENGDFKLGDFGIARTVERTMSGLSKKGTYNYMAPEVYKGLDYGFSVDIYSLGLVLYRLLNKNRAPFLPPAPQPITYGGRERALACRMSGEEIPAPCCASGRLWEIVRKATTYQAGDRYSSPGVMRQELEAILYSQEDAAFIYPEGDEVALQENIYASMSRKAGEKPSRQEKGKKASCQEMQEKTARQEKPEKAPWQEGREKPVGQEKLGEAPWDGMEETLSVFGGRQREAEFGAESAPDGGKKKSGGKRRLAAVLCGGAGALVTAAFLAIWFLAGHPEKREDISVEASGSGMSENAASAREDAAETYEALKAQAEQLYGSDPGKAMELMGQALALFPEEDAARTDYAYALYRTGDYEGCISYGEKNLAMGKDFEPELQSRLCEILGAAYFEKGDYAGAASCFRLSGAGGEMREDVMRDYAVCLARLGSLNEAKDVLAQMRSRGANSEVTRYVEGEVAFVSEEYGEAEKLFTEVMEEAEDTAIKQKAFRSLVQLYRDCASLEAAGVSHVEDAADKAVRLLLTGIGEYGLSYDTTLYEALGKAAYDAYGAARAKGEERETDYLSVAAEAFERVLAQGMEKEYLYTNLYSIRYEQGDLAAAGETLDRMEKAYPQSYMSHALRGVLLITLENQKPESERDYRGTQAEYETAGSLLTGTSDRSYYDQLGSLIEQLKEQGWL